MEKIIHQIYWPFDRTKPCPKTWIELSAKCKKIYTNSGWEYKLWNKKMGSELVKKKFPWLKRKYMFSSNIEKVDILRYCILYEYGGMYIDMDTDCIAVFEPELDKTTKIILGTTTLYSVPLFNSFYAINNNLLVSKPKAYFWKSLLRKINKREISEFVPKFIRVSMIAGPYALQEHYYNWTNKREIKLVEKLNVSGGKNYFSHESTKSWVGKEDAIHLSLYIFTVVFFGMKLESIKNSLILFVCLNILMIFLLCRKS